jgi:hypothetical protein
VLINPVVTPLTEEIEEGWEGCLSVPDMRGCVPRFTAVRLECFDRDGEKVDLVAKEFFARVIQHETDHLKGIVYVDRMRDLSSLSYTRSGSATCWACVSRVNNMGADGPQARRVMGSRRPNPRAPGSVAIEDLFVARIGRRAGRRALVFAPPPDERRWRWAKPRTASSISAASTADLRWPRRPCVAFTSVLAKQTRPGTRCDRVVTGDACGRLRC